MGGFSDIELVWFRVNVICGTSPTVVGSGLRACAQARSSVMKNDQLLVVNYDDNGLPKKEVIVDNRYLLKVFFSCHLDFDDGASPKKISG